jgi:hypothetical protein
MTQEETSNLLKTAQTSKVVKIRLHVPSHPHFIGRRRDFYVPKVPSSSRNIPNVNTYMNVFYISYIYKPATSSHAKHGLFEATSLTWLLAGSRVSPFTKIFIRRDFRARASADIPDFPQTPDFMVSRDHDSESSQVRDLRSFAGSRFQTFADSRLRDFSGPGSQIFATSRFLENSFHEFRNARRFESDGLS